VARMEQIEDPVGKCYLILPLGSPALCLRPRRNFCRRVDRLQSLLITIGWKWMTCSFLKGSLITSS
jgi:hypothetical protein